MTITHHLAYRDYLDLGPSRSLRKLHRYYTKQGSKAPSLDTLKNWSRKNNWRARIKGIEDQVAREIDDLHVMQNVEALCDLQMRIIKNAAWFSDYSNDLVMELQRSGYKKLSLEQAMKLHIQCLIVLHNLNVFSGQTDKVYLYPNGYGKKPMSYIKVGDVRLKGLNISTPIHAKTVAKSQCSLK